MTAAELTRLLGLVRFAQAHNARGNTEAVREALDDAEALIVALTQSEPDAEEASDVA